MEELAVGDRVHVPRSAEHTPRTFLGCDAVVLETATFGTPRRPWAHLEFGTGRCLWLPMDRLTEPEVDQ